MEMKKFEEFYSLCERTISRQRLLGADNEDIAFVLTGMMATLPEDELTLPQHKKLIDLAVGKKEACVAKMLLFYSNKEFEERLERIKKNLNEDTKKGDPSRYPYLVGCVTAITEKAYTPEQLRRIFDLANEA